MVVNVKLQCNVTLYILVAIASCYVFLSFILYILYAYRLCLVSNDGWQNFVDYYC